MANPIYESMKPMNPMQLLQQLKSDPAQFMKNKGFNLPDGVDVNNPQSIINGLMQSGQVNNNRYLQAMQMLTGKK